MNLGAIRPSGITSDVETICGTWHVNNSEEALLWNSGSLAVLAGGTAFESAFCSGISKDGQLVALQYGTGHWLPTVFNIATGRLLALQYPSGYVSGGATAISANGRYAAGWMSQNYNGAGAYIAVVWDLRTGNATNLNLSLSQSYVSATALGVDNFGDVVGVASDQQTQRGVLWKNGTVAIGPGIGARPIVRITSTPWIGKDPSTGDFTIFIPTTEALFRSNGTINLTLVGPGLVKTITRNVPRGASSNTWGFDLPANGIPRFTRPMQFTIYATAFDSNVASATVSRVMPEIKLPVIIVKGILAGSEDYGYDDDPANPNGSTTLTGYLVAHGYTRSDEQGALYPSLFGLRYSANTQLLQANAGVLGSLIDQVTDSVGTVDGPMTYANRVDIVGHSKGGLVARMLIQHDQDRASKVRKLILACSPHTGATWANLGWLGFIDGLRSDVARELLPTFPWWRPDPFADFGEPYDNAALKEINQLPMPAGVIYYRLYGYGATTAANYTDVPPTYRTGDGDAIVLAWSAMGYQVVNENTFFGDIHHQGEIIPAFAGFTQPAIGLPYVHWGFLGNAREVITNLLRE